MSGKKGIHPSFVQTMLSDSRYDGADIINAINNLAAKEAKNFNTSALVNANNFYKEKSMGTWSPSKTITGREVLILAPGPSSEKHREQIERYIRERSPIVIALNLASKIADKYINYKAICHPIRFLTAESQIKNQKSTIITPIKPSTGWKKGDSNVPVIEHFGMQVKAGQYKFYATYCISPSPLVLAYVLAIAVSGKASSISIVGIDGYPPGDARNNEVDNILKVFVENKGNISINSLTPTAHSAIECKSIYGAS